jgi:Na+-driven multidrug efflux pump
MVANVFHSPAGPRAARRLAARIVLMSAAYCVAAAAATLALRSALPRIFTRDPQVLALVRSAEAPAALMMAIAWNNCLEGCLLGEFLWGGGRP